MIFLKYLFIFLLFSILGWILELIYRSIITKTIVNPGFMTGCVVPIYGFGAVIMNIICTLIIRLNTKFEIVIITIAAYVCLTSLEFIAGYLLLKIYHLRLWDYTDRKFNIKGFVCLRFSLVWALLSLLYYYFIFPYIDSFAIRFLQNNICLFTFGILVGTFIIDLFISFDLLKKLHNYADSLKEVISIEKIKVDSISNSTRKKIWRSVYPYISTNKFLKEKTKKK